MSIEAHKALIRHLFEEGFKRGNLAIVDELFDSDFVDRSTPGQLPGIEGVKDYIRMVRAGFPDIVITIEDLVAEGDKIAARTTWHGTHLGEYEGIAPTGKQVTRTMIQIFRIAAGKLREEWTEGEGLGQLL